MRAGGAGEVAGVTYLLEKWGLSLGLASGISAVVKTLILLTFVAVSAIFFIWLERKVAGRIQDRLGPTRVGGKFGWLQTLADGMKLLVKEDVIPENADHLMFRLGPYIALAGSFMAFLVLPLVAILVWRIFFRTFSANDSLRLTSFHVRRGPAAPCGQVNLLSEAPRGVSPNFAPDGRCQDG